MGFIAAMAVSMVIAGMVAFSGIALRLNQIAVGFVLFLLAKQLALFFGDPFHRAQWTAGPCVGHPPPIRHPGAGASVLLPQRVGVRKFRGRRRGGCFPVPHPARTRSPRWVSARRLRMPVESRSTCIATSPLWSAVPSLAWPEQRYLSIRLRDGGRTYGESGMDCPRLCHLRWLESVACCARMFRVSGLLFVAGEFQVEFPSSFRSSRNCRSS